MILLKRGEVAYKNYMANGKTLLYAKILKDNNERIRQLALDKGYFLPIEQQSNMIDLVTHIDIWSVLWEDLYKSKKYRLNEEFSFENRATFPKEAVSSLCAFYLDIIDDGNRTIAS